MKNKPLVSVIIPTYKEPEVLDLCLRSIIEGQANKNQIIVIVLILVYLMSNLQHLSTMVLLSRKETNSLSIKSSVISRLQLVINLHISSKMEEPFLEMVAEYARFQLPCSEQHLIQVSPSLNEMRMLIE